MRLISGLLGAALVAMLGAAHGRAPLALPPRTLDVARLAPPEHAPRPEVRAAQERIPKAPTENAARTRRPSGSGAPGILPAMVEPQGSIAPLVQGTRSSLDVPPLPSECGHCTRAPRPPPIS